MEKLRQKKDEEKENKVQAIEQSKREVQEIEGLLMILRSIVKTHLYPMKDTTLKGIIKDIEGEQEFAIDCSNITSRELHERIWKLISEYRNDD